MKINRSKKFKTRRRVLASALLLVIVLVATKACSRDKKEIIVPVQDNTPVVTEVVAVEQVGKIAPTHTSLSRGGSVQASVAHSNDVYLLARLVESEAAGESFAGKLGVATVVVNRMAHDNTKLFGGPSVEGVVYKKGQFDGVGTELFNKEPSEDSIKAAHQVLVEGYRSYGPEVVYYFNPKTSTDKDFINSVKVVGKIGKHQFAVNR